MRHPSRIIILSFLVLISIGVILLRLPAAVAGPPLSFIDAFFTSTSAVCVTGLVVVDTGSVFTTFGQAVILMLIQSGGLGIMTLSTFFVYLVAGRLSVKGRDILEDTLTQQPMASLGRLLKSVFLTTLVIELAGCAFLTFSFLPGRSLARAAYLALFHSVSAFCNAGFSLFSNSLESYPNDIFTNGALSVLIISGGLGFVVIHDLYRNRKCILRREWSSLTYHARIVLSTTGLLLLSGTLIFFILEYHNTLSAFSFPHKLLAAFFQSVTARTAGFNSIKISLLTNSTLFFMMMLMFIGASPGSCGGGIKTSTFAILTASVFARFRMEEDVNIFYRRIPAAVISRAISVLFFSIFVVVLSTMVILIMELRDVPHPQSRGMFLDYMFEVVSAFGTVGLSTGVTAGLSDFGKFLIAVVMFIGRLGPLTIALAVRGRETQRKFTYVQGNVMVG